MLLDGLLNRFGITNEIVSLLKPLLALLTICGLVWTVTVGWLLLDLENYSKLSKKASFLFFSMMIIIGALTTLASIAKKQNNECTTTGCDQTVSTKNRYDFTLSVMYAFIKSYLYASIYTLYVCFINIVVLVILSFYVTKLTSTLSGKTFQQNTYKIAMLKETGLNNDPNANYLLDKMIKVLRHIEKLLSFSTLFSSIMDYHLHILCFLIGLVLSILYASTIYGGKNANKQETTKHNQLILSVQCGIILTVTMYVVGTMWIWHN